MSIMITTMITMMMMISIASPFAVLFVDAAGRL
jgi:hypothetical protein